MMREFIRDAKAIGFWRCVYGLFFYRPHMRALHKFGRHKWKKVGPLLPYTPGRRHTFLRCDWCGKTKGHQ